MTDKRSALNRRLEILALCIGQAAAGTNGFPAIWVAALLQHTDFSSTQLGWLASGEIAAIAVAALATSVWNGAIGLRRKASAGALVIVAANVIAVAPWPGAIIIGRLASGIGMGVLTSSVIGYAAKRENGQRVIALMQMVTLLFMSGVLFFAARFLSPQGPLMLFGLLAGTAAMSAWTAWCWLPDARPQSDRIKSAAASMMSPATFVACAAFLLAPFGVSLLFTYEFVITRGLGFTPDMMGPIIAVVMPSTLLGLLVAQALGERFGLLAPALAALGVSGVAVLFMVTAPSPIVFGCAMALLGISMMFYGSYAIAFVGRLDRSGRVAGATPALNAIGNASGPAVGGMILGASTFQMLGLFAAAFMGLAIALYCAAARLEKPGAAKVVAARLAE